MAVEIDLEMYLSEIQARGSRLPPLPENDEESSMEQIASESSSSPHSLAALHEKLEQARCSLPRSHKLFRYNPMHDLESLWWIALHFVVNKEARLASSSDLLGSSGTPSYQSHTASTSEARTSQCNLNGTQLAFARSLFGDGQSRWMALIADKLLQTHLQSRSPPLDRIGEALCGLRYYLYQRYAVVGREDYEIDKSVCAKGAMYRIFEAYFHAILKILEEGDVTVSSLPPTDR